MPTNVRQLASRVEQGAQIRQRGSPPHQQPGPEGKTTFAEELRRAREQAFAPEAGIKLSAHAEDRIRQRGISMSAPEQQALAQAMQQLEAKGSQDALLLRSDAAFVVNVPSRTVVTAIEQAELHDRVFTKIDSAALV